MNIKVSSVKCLPFCYGFSVLTRCVIFTRWCISRSSLSWMPETKWPPFWRRRIQMHFPERKHLNFTWNFFGLGSGNGLVPNRRQATIWTNDGLLYSNIYMSLGSMSDRNWYQYWGHCCLINDLGSSPQPEGEARGLWWASQVVNETTMTEIEVSISILSWWN